jgi:hypothetical protein
VTEELAPRRDATPAYFSASLISISRFKTSLNSSGKPIPFSATVREKYSQTPPFYRRGKENFCTGRNAIQTLETCAEIDLSRHLVIFDGSTAHTHYHRHSGEFLAVVGNSAYCLLAIIEKRIFLNGRPTVSPWDGGKWINPKTAPTADRALAHGRV